MHIHGSFFYINMVAPNFVEQHASAVHPLGVAHQVLQKLELCRPYFEWFFLPTDTVSIGIQLQRPNFDHPSGRLWDTPTQDSPNTRQQLPRRERFDNVIVGSCIQPGHAIRLITTGSQHQNRDRFGPR